jgi:hypothetical protein
MKRPIRLAAIAAIGAGALLLASSASANTPAWSPIAGANPTHLPPGGSGSIVVYAQNVGGATSSGTIKVVDKLPAGLVTKETPSGVAGGSANWSCPTTEGPGLGEVTCELTAAIESGFAAKPLRIPVNVLASNPETLTNEVRVSSPGALSGGYLQSVAVDPTPAKPGLQAAVAAAYDPDGMPSSQAGSHPYAGTAAVLLNTVIAPSGGAVPAGDLKTALTQLPAGFLGNPVAIPLCPEGLKDAKCPRDTQVGTAQISINFPDTVSAGDPVHAVQAPVGYPAKFTFEAEAFFQVNAVGSLRSDEDYGLNVESPNTAQLFPVFGYFFNFWGAPASPAHDSQRCNSVAGHQGCGPSSASNTAFLTLPSDCAFEAEQPPFVNVELDSWLTPGLFTTSKIPVPSVTGCENLRFGTSEEPVNFTFEPSETKSDSPAAFRTSLTVPSEGLTDPEKLSTPPIREAVVQLPRGVTLNAGAADGLSSCSEAQIGLKNEIDPATGLPIPLPMPNPIRFNKEPNHCPDASKIGSSELKSALLDETLDGALYLADQGNGNPFGSLFAIYLVIENPQNGIFIKLPGKVEPDSQTGQMTVTFDNLPQLPFTSLKLNLKGGSRSALASPTTCGNYLTTATNTPWSAPESGPPAVSANGFEINQGPNGEPCAKTPQARPFNLGWKAGAEKTTAGASGPFDFQITRPDGSQELNTLELNTPPGLSASLKGVPYCTEAEIHQIEKRMGKEEQANSACPAASQVGTAVTGSGSGPSPFYTDGKLYLAGPYEGAPLSVLAVTPAVAGPFDLGNVVVRSAVFIDHQTAQVTAKTDPIPQVLDGVVLRIRDVWIHLDRKDWTINPTSCEPSSVELKATGNSGAVTEKSARFQVGGCPALNFKPKLTAKITGPTKRGKLPAFTATLTYPEGPGYANVKDVQVTLPHSEFLEQAHINTICTRVQAAAHACPAGSIYGYAEATTPLLDGVLKGPVFLKSSVHKLPDLAIALRGPDSQPVEVEFAGRIDSIHGQIRNTIEGLPDVPVSRFVLKMKGGKKGLLVNSRNLCQGKPGRMTVDMTAQNNKRADSRPLLGNSCGKAKKHKKDKKHSKRDQLSQLVGGW